MQSPREVKAREIELKEKSSDNDLGREGVRAARPPSGSIRGRVQAERALEGQRKERKGAWGMPVALGGDEGRDKLRKAAARGKCPATRGCPNGETRRERSRHTAAWRWANPGN